MIIEPNSCVPAFQIKKGVKNRIELNRSYSYRVVTTGGTIIEGTATINTPLEITPADDIKDVRLIITDKDVSAIHVVE